jgi:hypothetical protein
VTAAAAARGENRIPVGDAISRVVERKPAAEEEAKAAANRVAEKLADKEASDFNMIFAAAKSD